MSVSIADDARSIISDTATLVDRPVPPIETLLLPGHTTRASKLHYDTSQGKYTTLEYMELTFSIMVTYNNRRGPLVVAIDEDYNILLGDIQREFPRLHNQLRIKELGISWGGREFGSNDVVQRKNMVAMMRLLKARGGQDMIMVK